LRNAVARGEMHLHFQPQVDAKGRVFGAEALLRWKHPQRGMIPPSEFIPVAERSGLMISIGEWVLKSACEQIAQWGLSPETATLVLAVNVSASQFARPQFVQTVLDCLDQACIDPTRLKLELTESMLADNIEQIVTTMNALKNRGVGFSLDDFGTGFSSLSYLRRLPLDQLKIDQSFVRGMSASEKDEAIVKTIISLGLSLGFQVIAEGVETEDEHQKLAAMGCMTYQGYLFSKPLAIGNFDDYVRERRRAARLRLKIVGGRAVEPGKAAVSL
jgi:EAL domain-containing protein (putative c-di-GMP-specific phosphodiesterase class I)